MAITFLVAGSAATNSTAGTSNAPGIPAGCTNLTTRMYAFVSINGDKTASINTPAGWTKLGAQFQTSGVTLAVYAKWFATGDGAPTFTWTTNNKNTGRILAYNGLDLTNPEDLAIDSTFFNGSAATTTPTSVTKTAVTMGAVRIHASARAGTGTSTPDERMAERCDQTTSSTSPAALAVADEMGMAAGALGTRADTVTSAIWCSFTMWLRPATPATFGVLQSKRYTSTASATSHAVAFQNALTSGSNLIAQVAAFGGSGTTLTSVKYGAGALALTKDAPSDSISTNLHLASYYYQNNADTTAATVTLAISATQDAGIIIYEISGAATTGTLVETDGVGNNTNTAVTATTGTTGSGERWAVMYFSPTSSQSSITASATYDYRGANIDATHMAWGAQTREFAGGGTETATATLGTSSEWASTLIILKPPATDPMPLLPYQGAADPLYRM